MLICVRTLTARKITTFSEGVDNFFILARNVIKNITFV